VDVSDAYCLCLTYVTHSLPRVNVKIVTTSTATAALERFQRFAALSLMHNSLLLCDMLVVRSARLKNIPTRSTVETTTTSSEVIDSQK